jgi:exodeoxyribonuclease V alpha subunit
MVSWDDSDYFKWFHEKETDYWYQLSADKERTQPKERSFLYSLGRLSSSETPPSIKQLKWAKQIVDRLESGVSTPVDIKEKKAKGKDEKPMTNHKSDKHEIKECQKVKDSSSDGTVVEAKHITVRMAWHDNNWDGQICQDPETNTYCVGAHSLLSGRIEKKRKLEFETSKKGSPVASLDPADNPPCYWSINAFGKSPIKVIHRHAFQSIKDEIKDILKPYSVFTWPFRLSFVHNSDNQKKRGNYPPDLGQRVANFKNKFKPKQSIIFFYANYDNPVSADEMKYLLLGCSTIQEISETQKFAIPDDEMKRWRSNEGMQNFEPINWSIQFTHDPTSTVLLPYREYIRYAEQHPEDEEKLAEMKVVIDEPSLVSSFKYVAMDIDDDKCLYLLYKLRKSIKKMQEHKQQVVKSDFKREEDKLSQLIEGLWSKRGIYPSLHHVLNHYLENPELAMDLSKALMAQTSEATSLQDIMQSVIDKKIVAGLKKWESDLLELADTRIFRKNFKSLVRLSLINLTPYQISEIISDSRLLESIASNPYELYESYMAGEDDLDNPDLQDEPIDVYKIDVAMIPDRKYVKRHRQIQNLGEDSPERVRSVIINYLNSIGELGHCYDNTVNIINDVKEHPLIYKNNVRIDESAIVNLGDDYKSHFIEKLHIKSIASEHYLYLKKVKADEDLVRKIVLELTSRTDYPEKGIDFNEHIKASLLELKKTIPNFDESLFKEERSQLYRNVFAKSFFLLTGKPGAGKTYEISKVIEHLNKLNEGILVLAPTGKAALRLSENLKAYTKTDIAAVTIDKYIYDNKYQWAYEDSDRLANLPDQEKLTVENLIIDETSMLDLVKLKILFSVIRFSSKYPKRVIMVGDENQLPPIGFGKPFHDIINFIINNDQLRERHYINLQSNCRQENDINILKLAEAFTDKKRYYEEAFDLIAKEGKISDGLYVYKWKNKEILESKLEAALDSLFGLELHNLDLKATDVVKKMNLLYGLYENGYVNQQGGFSSTLALDKFQILSPYRAGYYGTLGVNKLIQKEYRSKSFDKKGNTDFYHSDKIIRLQNWYAWDKRANKRTLRLSNGSIGIINDHKDDERKYYFKDCNWPLSYVDSEDLFDLAYAITVHKSQGSDFRNVFMVVPNKFSLLSKELIYTALTRSKYRLYVFIQDADDNLLVKAKNISHLLHRNTSIFADPIDNKKKYVTSKGKPVKSKIEYILCQALEKSGLEFEYEDALKLPKRDYTLHPDFTIRLKNNKVIYWEHLGMLDTRKYYRDWQRRKTDYLDHGLFDAVITTDDLEGVHHEKVDKVIEDMRENNLLNTPDNRFSNHHYTLY